LPSLHFVRQGDCTCPPDREHPCSQVFRPGMAAIRIGEPRTGRAKRYTTMRAQARNQGSKEYLTMSKRDVYTVQVAGLTRHLPLFEVAPGVRIAIFNMLGDTYVAKAAAAALAERLRGVEADVLLTAEAKSMPLVYEMSALMGLPYIVLRKSYKSYMGDALSAETVSITTGRKQTLYLDEKDFPRLQGKRAIVIDDVISTGST